MDFRSSLLALLGSPDRAWFGLLVGTLLIVRELARPGRVWAGLLGAVLAVSAGAQLGTRGLPLLLATAACIVAASLQRGSMSYVLAACASAIGVATGRIWGASWLPALVAVPVVWALVVLGSGAVKGRRNKMKV